jgi:electron transport complex protein RnfC
MGMPMEELVAAAGGLTDDVWKVINGGPMMGLAQSDLAAPVIKGSNAILCLSNAQNGESEDQTCIRCGKCLTVCPMKLQPIYMYRFANVENYKKLEKLNVIDCMECGACSYTCPAKLPLTETFKMAKIKMKEVKE